MIKDLAAKCFCSVLVLRVNQDRESYLVDILRSRVHSSMVLLLPEEVEELSLSRVQPNRRAAPKLARSLGS